MKDPSFVNDTDVETKKMFIKSVTDSRFLLNRNKTESKNALIQQRMGAIFADTMRRIFPIKGGGGE